jgi:GT2 family glycosyltransferase
MLSNGPDGEDAMNAATSVLPLPSLEVHFLQEGDNVGFAGGMNLCCEAATGDILVVANLDLAFDAEFIDILQHAGPFEPPALIAPSVQEPRQGEEEGALKIGFLHRLRRASDVPEHASKIAAGNGSCIILPRGLYELRMKSSGGLFDPEYHSYYEDVDLFWWSEDNQIPVLFDPRLAVVHHHAGSFAGKYRFRDREPLLQVSIMANYRVTVWKHARGGRHVIGWLLGEGGYLLMSWRAHSARGVRLYLRSWNLSVKRVMAIRRRRGRLRAAPVSRAAPHR